MAKWLHSDAQDNGPNYIKTNANSWRLIKAYTAGDSYATVNGNTVAAAAMSSADYTFSGAASASRVLTVASGKTATASADSGATPALHFAFVDTVNSKVLWVTDETSDQQVVTGNTVNFPSGIALTAPQPV